MPPAADRVPTWRAVRGGWHRDRALEDFELATGVRIEFEAVELRGPLREVDAGRQVNFVGLGGQDLRVVRNEVRFDPFCSNGANTQSVELGVCVLDELTRLLSAGVGSQYVCAGGREQ